MHRCILILAGLVLTQISWGGEATAKRLGELLEPRAGGGILVSPPAEFAGPRARPLPHLVLGKFQGQPPRPHLVAAKPIYPQLTPEPAPLALYFASPVTPQETVMPTTALIVIPDIVDVNQTPVLPILTPQPLNDRAALADATLEASVAASHVHPLPPRSSPVPFVAMNLPDPFEFQQYIRLPSAPPEEGPTLTIPASILVVPAPKK